MTGVQTCALPISFLLSSIAKFKVPSKIWFRTEPIPRNANGKFLKREVRKELIGE